MSYTDRMPAACNATLDPLNPTIFLLSMHTWRYIIMGDWEKFPYNILFFWFSTYCQSGPIFPQFRLGSGLNNLLWGVLDYIRTPLKKIHCNMHTSDDSCLRHALHLFKQASLSPVDTTALAMHTTQWSTMHTSHIWSGDNPKLMVAHVTVVADKGALPQTSHNRMSPSPHVKHCSLHHVRPGVPLAGEQQP